ncbi:MAG TPA: hypothetical protein VFS71_07550 [Flavobacterium sp.]|uniref:hypothetical protein n=1 Tax=Flavobacterium sp. TaxID=239 RepID=UPI002DB8E3ED|nr:hypothetical protein [Flavobacterium sp.]HEU4789523.1 hypothetical protein [Flavobacterium sp.]
MRNIFLLLLSVFFFACQSTKIKNDTYKVSDTAPELGSVGQSKLGSKANNEFAVRTLPKLENNIRIAIEVVPFNRKLYRIYKAKARYNQDQSNVAYVDSLPKKPELATVRLLDVLQFVNELNADYNKDVFRFIKDTQNSEVVSSLAFCFSVEDINKIKQADTFYLTNYQDSKYAISLYKLGKKTDTLFINSLNIVAYRLSKFCWGVTERGEWYIGDIIEENTKCNGVTKKKIPKKEKQESLFDM